MQQGNNIIDYHGCDFFPERWFQLVVVLRTDNSILYSRLEKRHYSNKKITENIECEIMQVILEEARESYNHEIIWELENNTVDQMEKNAEKIIDWYQNYHNF
jgi:adenylate kinase